MRPVFSYPELGKVILKKVKTGRMYIPFKKQIRAAKFEYPILEGELYYYENGLTLHGERHRIFNLLFGQCEEIYLLNKV